MSEFEKEELTNRINGMTEEQLLLVVGLIPVDMLWDELRKRDNKNREIIEGIKQTVEGGAMG